MERPPADSHAAAPLEFWFEFASPYSYVAAMQIESLCRDAAVPLVWKPFLLGPIFALQGWETSHFNLNARRGAYMWRDVERLTTKLGVPWQKPSSFPRATTAAARVACVGSGEPWMGDFVRRIYVANFGEDRDIGSSAVLVSLLEELGHDGAALVRRSESLEWRGTLRANTGSAIELGMFGAPNCLVARELFWGEEAMVDAIEWCRRPR